MGQSDHAITYLGDHADESDRAAAYSAERARIVAEFHALATGSEILMPSWQHEYEVLSRLAAGDRLMYQKGADGAVEIHYNPSKSAIEAVCAAEMTWPSSMVKRVAKLVRRTPGALFKLPFETGEGEITVFVTDWSSCTASCAVALHRFHRVVREQSDEPPEGSAFLGRHVRHPLTGDLLAVWVADWVKPDFGTGAVLINPGHNRTDLEFARSVGLPIRFALSPTGTTDSRETWPLPPVIRTGKAVRAGIFDGMAASEVQSMTIEMLVESGFATPHTDTSIPSQPIARLVPDDQGPLLFDFTGLKAADSTANQSSPNRFSLRSTPALSTASDILVRDARTLFASARSTKAEAVNLAAILADCDFPDRDLRVTLVQSVEGKVPTEMDDAVALALLVGDRVESPLVLRDQLTQQTTDFIEKAKRLRESAREAEGAEPPESIEALIRERNAVGAFREMSKWQKTALAAGERVDREKHAALVNTFLRSSEW